MGRMAAEEMVSMTDVRTALSWHLSTNHYPPVAFMLQPCLDAIEAVEDGEPSRYVTLPLGVEWKGQEEAPAYALVESFHLQPFLSDEE